MVSSAFHPTFKKTFSKIKDSNLKKKIIKQFHRIGENPEVGKPMMHMRKGTREVYIPPFRLSYVYIKSKQQVIFLDIYHKDQQ